MRTKYVLKIEEVYGVSVVNEKGGVINSITALGKTKEEVLDFINLCNTEKLEPIHLRSAITDILYK